jgi:uncharacterized damage-inducible protein DinB
MTLEILLKDYCAYNLWANELIVNWLKPNPAELLEHEVPSSFPSLRTTLMHIWAAEDVWLNRLKALSPTEFISETYVGSNGELFDHLLQNSELFKNFVLRQSDDFFSNTTQYKHTSGKNYEQYNSEIILHCMQHSTYHRGQIVTIARNLGLNTPPKTDFIEYVRQRQAEL